MSRKILITGSTGFVGKMISRDLINEGHTVYSLVFDGTPAEGTIPVHGDITDPDSLNIPRIDCLIHCAGILESSHASAELMNRVTFEGTRNIVQACFKAGMKDMVFMSTISASGPQGSSKNPINEDMPPCPNDAYGVSKVKAEEHLKKFAGENDVNIAIIRPPVLYGEGMNPGSSAMKTFENVRSGHFPLVDKGIHTFNFLYVGNLSHAIRVLIRKNSGIQIYNVNEGPYTAIEVISAISQDLGIEKGYTYYPRSALFIYSLISRARSRITGRPPRLSSTKYRALTTDSWKIDHKKLMDITGYEPVFSLSEGVNRTIQYYGWNKK